MKKLLLGASLLASMSALAQTPQHVLTIGDDAPALKVATWLKGGEPTTFEKDKVTVMEFWATWCGPCLANIPHLSKVAEEFKSQGVNVYAVSVRERKGTDADSLRRFVAGPKGQQMHYTVGADDGEGYMYNNWVKAADAKGIPFAVVVDKSGKIAWKGHPGRIDKPLAKIASGNWDLKQAKAEFEEQERLNKIELAQISTIQRLLRNNNYTGALALLDSVVTAEPTLKYSSLISHFRFQTLLESNPQQAIAFAKEQWAHTENEGASDVYMSIKTLDEKGKTLSKEVYQLGVEAIGHLIVTIPSAKDYYFTYADLARMQFAVGNKKEAVTAQKQALKIAADTQDFKQEDLAKLQETLKQYEAK